MPTEDTDPKDHRSQIRIPADLADYLKAKARENSRSLNSEIAHRLKQSRAVEQATRASQ